VQSTDKDTSTTLQASSPSLFAPAWEGRERSFWRQLLGAIMEGRQRKADETIRDYLRRHRGERPDAFRSELERRLLGQ
jgi:DNA-binding FadR family transcriptional regulator